MPSGSTMPADTVSVAGHGSALRVATKHDPSVCTASDSILLAASAMPSAAAWKPNDAG
jgi:hypothetical protein